MKSLIQKLADGRHLDQNEWVALIAGDYDDQLLFDQAVAVRQRVYGRDVYIRGLIELSNFCANDCYYCGIRCSNALAERYRLTEEDILARCEAGYALGFRTFVLQGGEDGRDRDDYLIPLIRKIKAQWPDCALTLSLGERSRESYQALYDAGANRYLLRHETANAEHYARLHPPFQRFEERIRCIKDLLEIGFQTGSGFMVGSPFQTPEYLAQDMLLLEELQPQMVGIGPFIPHHQTPFAEYPAGSLELSLRMVALSRLLLPQALIPATTALATLDPQGRERGILAGANVVMPNLSPADVRKKYLLYDNKACTGLEAAEALDNLRNSMAAIGYQVVTDRGDWKKPTE
ncbi:MAG: [FeFe] hydrogenase H-cluster radical SAM maturase HydE [Bacillota bacterium]|nr:[FeFe] hydrogenase H-cluster radical SAM maturase HydE [Bacillota bacterium]